MKQFRFVCVIFVWTSLTVLAGSCKAVEPKAVAEQAQLQLIPEPPKRQLEFKTVKKTLTKEEWANNFQNPYRDRVKYYPRFVATLEFQTSDVRNSRDRFYLYAIGQDHESFSGDLRSFYGDVCYMKQGTPDQTGFTLSQTNKQFKVFADTQEQLKELVDKALACLDGSVRTEIEEYNKRVRTSRERLPIQMQRKEVFEEYLKELRQKERDCYSQYYNQNISTDALDNLSVDQVNELIADYRKELARQNLGHAGREQLEATEGVINYLHRYLDSRGKKEKYTRQIEEISRSIREFKSDISGLTNFLDNPKTFQYPQLVDNTIMVCEVEVVE